MITNLNPNIIRLTKNHEFESEYSGFGGKDSNPNPNIRYNTDPVRICEGSLTADLCNVARTFTVSTTLDVNCDHVKVD